MSEARPVTALLQAIIRALSSASLAAADALDAADRRIDRKLKERERKEKK